MLRQVAKNELRDGYSVATRREGMVQLAAQAQRMGIEPDVLLTPKGRDAFVAIARALRADAPKKPVKKRKVSTALRAEWTLIIECFFQGSVISDPVMP